VNPVTETTSLFIQLEQNKGSNWNPQSDFYSPWTDLGTGPGNITENSVSIHL
jgi:hypothetical protein